MALFQFKNSSFEYEIYPAPFAFDLLLLPGSRFDARIWEPVLEEFEPKVTRGGRMVVCSDSPADGETLARFVTILGLQELRVVAIGDSVAIARDAELGEVLEFPDRVPKGSDLARLVREFIER